jgi:hypothetical protein
MVTISKINVRYVPLKLSLRMDTAFSVLYFQFTINRQTDACANLVSTWVLMAFVRTHVEIIKSSIQPLKNANVALAWEDYQPCKIQSVKFAHQQHMPARRVYASHVR